MSGSSLHSQTSLSCSSQLSPPPWLSTWCQTHGETDEDLVPVAGKGTHGQESAKRICFPASSARPFRRSQLHKNCPPVLSPGFTCPPAAERPGAGVVGQWVRSLVCDAQESEDQIMEDLTQQAKEVNIYPLLVSQADSFLPS